MILVSCFLKWYIYCWHKNSSNQKKPLTLSTYKPVFTVYHSKHLEVCLPTYDLLHDVLSDLCLLSSSTWYKTCQLWKDIFFVMWMIALEEFHIQNTTCSWRHNSDFCKRINPLDVAVRCILLWLSRLTF